MKRSEVRVFLRLPVSPRPNPDWCNFGNTPDSGSGDSWFEPKVGSKRRARRLVRYGVVAQLGERSAENREVTGSTPVVATSRKEIAMMTVKPALTESARL